MDNFDQFLLDHAAAEKKAAGMALSMLSHYPDRTRLVTAMSELAVEEMVHFREVIKHIQQRQLQLGADKKDPYVNEIRSWIRSESEVYLLDRLLTGAVIEARGAERFALVATALPSGELQRFYASLARSEARRRRLGAPGPLLADGPGASGKVGRRAPPGALEGPGQPATARHGTAGQFFSDFLF